MVVESPLTQIITGSLTGLTIVGAIACVYRISSQGGKQYWSHFPH